MSNQFSIVIRNKNEAESLEDVLWILTKLYAAFIKEIIVVDNNSKDNSQQVALNYGCRVVTIDQFTYGKAINVGIECCQSSYILLLSAHSIPVGEGFFSHSLEAFRSSDNIAGIRFINGIENYKRALSNNFAVGNPFQFGLTAACCAINKNVWEAYRFDEELVAIEDKDWSQRVCDSGFTILDLNETYFYFPRRSVRNSRNRYKNETIASYQLQNRSFSTPARSLLSFLKKIVITNNIRYLREIYDDVQMLQIKFEIYESLKRNNEKK